MPGRMYCSDTVPGDAQAVDGIPLCSGRSGGRSSHCKNVQEEEIRT